MGEPIRTCVGCRAKRPQTEMIRIVRTPEGIEVDSQGPGRGAYLCPEESCVRRAVGTGVLGRALRNEGPLGEGVLSEALSRARRRREVHGQT